MRPLPELATGDLSAADIERWFADLEAAATDVAVRVRSASGREAQPGPVDLGEARRRWGTGDARALQVRYAWSGAAWSDTLLRGPAGGRLVRICLDAT